MAGPTKYPIRSRSSAQHATSRTSGLRPVFSSSNTTTSSKISSTSDPATSTTHQTAATSDLSFTSPQTTKQKLLRNIGSAAATQLAKHRCLKANPLNPKFMELVKLEHYPWTVDGEGEEYDWKSAKENAERPEKKIAVWRIQGGKTKGMLRREKEKREADEMKLGAVIPRHDYFARRR